MTVIKQANLRVNADLMAALDAWGTQRYGVIFSQLGLATKAKMALEHALATTIEADKVPITMGSELPRVR